MSDNTVPSIANVRSKTYYIARAIAQCPDCGLATRLLALALPHFHEILDVDASATGGTDDSGDTGDGDSAESAWESADANAFLFYVVGLPDGVRRRLESLSPHYRPARSPSTQNVCWTNHCEHCGSLLDDHELHCEPDGAFSPSNEAAATGVQLLEILEPFEAAAAGYALEPEFFAFMARS